jgi:hypothetical protein
VTLKKYPMNIKQMPAIFFKGLELEQKPLFMSEYDIIFSEA